MALLISCSSPTCNATTKTHAPTHGCRWLNCQCYWHSPGPKEPWLATYMRWSGGLSSSSATCSGKMTVFVLLCASCSCKQQGCPGNRKSAEKLQHGYTLGEDCWLFTEYSRSSKSCIHALPYPQHCLRVAGGAACLLSVLLRKHWQCLLCAAAAGCLCLATCWSAISTLP